MPTKTKPEPKKQESKFEECLQIVLKHEGGFANHPLDPGGATKYGVTQKTWEAYVGHQVSIVRIKELTVEDVRPLYKSRYWDFIWADKLPRGINLTVFDFSVNAGPVRAVKYIQLMVGAKKDGVIGPQTLAKLESYILKHGITKTIKDYGELRRKFYKRLPTFKTFGKGWIRRVDEVTESSISMTK